MRIGAGAALAAATALLLAAPWPAPAAADAAVATRITVPGLSSPVEILIDRYGIPHIFARDESALFFAQGFNIARDRLFQLDLWRRRGRGELAAVFGAQFVEQDRAARLFLYRGDLAREWAAYGPGAQAIATRFAAGINAYIDYLDLHPDELPPEFRLLDYRPAHFAATDVVRIRSHGLSRNLSSEVARAAAVCAAGPEAGLAADRIRAPLSPQWHAVVPAGLEPCLPKDVLRVFELGARPLRLSTPGGTPVATIAGGGDATEGSNNWAIAPSKSTTGRPVLANDPHRDYVQPSIRYLVDLHAPTLNVAGANETSCRESRSATTRRSPSATRYSRSTRRTCTSTGRVARRRASTATAAAGGHFGWCTRRSRSVAHPLSRWNSCSAATGR